MEHKETEESVRKRVPLLKSGWMELYLRMGEHPHSPKWNIKCGDRLDEDDISFVRKFADNLTNRRESFAQAPPEWLVIWAEKMKILTPWFRDKLNSGDIKESWQNIIPMQRHDIQSRIDLIVPEDADLNRLIVNPTSGTTGNPIKAPNHPRGIGCYDPMIQYALERHGVEELFGDKTVAAIQICSQKKTITYHTVHSFHNGAGFAKINLSPENWKSPESAGIYLNEMCPVFLSGDPFSFMEYMRLGISYRPEAVLTTALALEKTLRKKLEAYFNCPVVDMYSLNETGPVAYSCPADPSKFHILPHDLFVEILSEDGKQLPEGEHGMIALSGGRNPYLPLLRYLTGDYASISYGECVCGEKTPSLRGLNGRALILFHTLSGKTINSIDIAGIIREYPVYAFQFIQKKDLSCALSLSAGETLSGSLEKNLQNRLKSVFDNEVEILIDRELKIDERKNIPFISELA